MYLLLDMAYLLERLFTYQNYCGLHRSCYAPKQQILSMAIPKEMCTVSESSWRKLCWGEDPLKRLVWYLTRKVWMTLRNFQLMKLAYALHCFIAILFLKLKCIYQEMLFSSYEVEYNLKTAVHDMSRIC